MNYLLSICAALTCLAHAATSDAAEGGNQKPNLLLLVSDDQRPDTIHTLGNEQIETPNLDRLVRTGVSFSRAICANPICTPSRAEILTGCSSFRNGVLDFGRKIKPELATWPRTMRDGGYHTWYVGKWHNNGRPSTHGYEESLGLYSGGGGRWYKPQADWKGMTVTGYRGWIFQTDEGEKFPELGVGLTPDISARFADAANEFIRRKPEKPFFLHVNFTAPHDPLLIPPGMKGKYDPAKIPLPKNFAKRHPFDHGNIEGRDEKMLPWPRTREMVRKNLAVYYAVITHMDQQIGRILESLQETGQDENTIVIFTSDHGLAVGSHGLMGKQSMYEHTINVPLLISGPGVPAAKRCDAQCYLRDMFPTACDMAEIPIPRTVEGKSLKPVILGEEDAVYAEVFGYFRDKQRMIRTDRWKLIHYPHISRYQLFDVRSDPFETNDLIHDQRHAETIAQLKQRLARKLAEWQ